VLRFPLAEVHGYVREPALTAYQELEGK
jgi:hypothetical protein